MNSHLWRGFEELERRSLFAAHIVGDPTVYATIQAAVDAALAGSTINVDPGQYAEYVNVDKPLTLRGARAGVDGRSSARGANETVIIGKKDPSGPNNISCIYVNASGVTVDGFTVQGNTSNGNLGAGIVIAPNKSGSTIVNNILQKNVAGLFLANNSTTQQTLIQHNLFYDNNLDGDHSGRAIYTNGGFTGGNLTNVAIDSNAFIKNFGSKLTTTTLEAAIALQTLAENAQSNIRITNNTFDGNGKAMLFFNTDNCLIEGNYITWCTDLYSAAIRFEGGNTNFTIRGNTMHANPGNLVRIDNKAVPGASYGFSITDNNFSQFGLNTATKAAIVVDPGQYDGPMDLKGNWWGSAAGPGNAIIKNDNNVDASTWATTPFAHPSNPAYMGTPWATDGIIEIENFDHGGLGAGYSDVDSANLGKAAYRLPWGVDIQTTTDTNGGYNIGYTKPGEWLAYTMDIAQAGTYFLDVRVAYSSTAGKFHFELDGQNITGTMSMLNTGGTQTWKTLTKSGVTLPAGRHVVKLVMDSGATIGNFNWFQFRNANPVVPPAAPSSLAAVLATPTSIALSWTDNANNETGFIIERKIGAGTWQLLTTTAANVQAHTDADLVAGTNYSYRVRAVNTAGPSGDSNEASASTPAVQSTTYLSDMAWVSANGGYGPVEKDMGNGGSAAGDGAPITLNGVVYPKGLGTHANSDIIYNLNGNYNFFVSDVGVDDRQAVNGSVIFQVFADGVKIYDSGVMGALSDTKSINVDVTGVQQLRLHVDDSGDGTAYDHADWAGARLVAGVLGGLAAPTGLAATPVSGTQIDLSWNDVADETGYRIERSEDGVTFTSIGTTAAGATLFSDTGVSGSTTYSYRVIATNDDDESDASNVASAAPLQAPAAPVISATPVSPTRVDVSWAGVLGASGYRVERSDDGVNFSPLATLGVVTSYSDLTVVASTSYSYRAVAINVIGESAASNVASVATPAAPTAPAAPSGLAATVVNYARIDLGWTDNAANETGFVIERSTDNVSFTLLATLTSPDVTTYSDTAALALNTTYYYRVRATNAVGDSENSNVASATTPATPPAPAAPSGLLATAISQTRIDLVWTDNATTETGFIVERSIDGVSFTQIATPAASATNYSDTTGLVAATKYYYRVRATNAGGDSDNSNVSNATTAAATGLPAGWSSGDIGPVGLAGSATYSGGVFTVSGAGADIYGTSDSFRFAAMQITGDATIVARVASLTNTDANAKAGVMIRESLSGNSKEASVTVTPANGIKFLRRGSTGGSTSSTTAASLKAPYWVKLVRSGNTFTAYTSANGSTWTLVGSQSITMTSTVYIGLAVTAHKTTAVATGVFDNVSIT